MKGIKKASILVVDDEKHICDIIVEAISSESFQVFATSDPTEALRHLRQNPVDLVLTDLVMGEYSGVQILETSLAYHSDAVVILMTAFPTVQTAISVLKKGAFDFLVKPFKLDLLRATVNRGLRHQHLLRDNLSLKGQVEFLKVANATPTGMKIDRFLKLVAASCKKELAAAAVGIIEVDPASRSVLQKIGDADDAHWIRDVLDESTVDQFIRGRSRKPVITSGRVDIDDRQTTKVVVSQPILIRRKLHGVINLCVLDRYERITPGQLDILSLLANSAASAISNHQLYQNLKSSYLQAIRALANAIEARDKCTRGHTERVSKLAELVARRLGWNETRIYNLRMGCSLHDIGKIGIPDAVLNKDQELTVEERRLMEQHPEMGLKIIEGIELFRPAVPYIIGHHERYDGSGYPYGISGVTIPIEGRLLAVVDAFDAIMATRPYREGSTLKAAVSELMTYKGIQFDPQIVDTFLTVLAEEAVSLGEMYGRQEDATFLIELLTEKALV